MNGNRNGRQRAAIFVWVSWCGWSEREINAMMIKMMLMMMMLMNMAQDANQWDPGTKQPMNVKREPLEQCFRKGERKDSSAGGGVCLRS
jgi:hypothetical protein